MKNLFLVLAAICMIGVAPSCKDKTKEPKSRADEKNVVQESEVPGAVTSAFTTKYPGATEIIWEDAKENDQPTYKVKFKRDDKYWKVEFKQDGSFVKEEEDN